MSTDLISLKKFTPSGVAAFETFVLGHTPASSVPFELLENPEYIEDFSEIQIDSARTFESRFEFGLYLMEVLNDLSFEALMAPASDAFWAWVSAVYFRQLSAPTPRNKDAKKPEHFLVVRQGFKGSLAYRNGARTSYELVKVHGGTALVGLSGTMGTFGEIAEALTSRSNIARDLGYFRAAHRLYLHDGKPVPGAASRARHPKKRKPGEKRGMGGAGRLALVLNRLTLTFDTAEMSSTQLIDALPREFGRFKKKEAS
jgi:hypothetical protein